MVLYYILLPLAWLVFHIGFRVRCEGRENLKKIGTKGCIIAPNHISAIDPGITMPKDVTVESFELDHTIVKAPYVRLISEEVGPKGDIITNFDIRLIQPNENSIDTGGLHTIEHLLAKLIRQRIDGLIDCSPFGCRTGFHMIMWGKQDPTEIAKVIKSSLEAIANEITWEDVPGTTIESCGNYKDHSLHSAKEWAKLILEQGISDQAFERHTV